MSTIKFKTKPEPIEKKISLRLKLKNIFDEKFLEEKDVALRPIDFSEIEKLEIKLDEEEKEKLQKEKKENQINNKKETGSKKKGLEINKIISNELLKIPKLNQKDSLKKSIIEYSKLNSYCRIVTEKKTFIDENSNGGDYLSKLVQDVMIKGEPLKKKKIFKHRKYN